jgi:predicted membrane metal-binding protein
VATQRSFIMIGVVLFGVLFDRPALTMRTLTIAALVVLLFAPESIVHPSFQMSFAATLALIAGYERGAIKLRGRADTSLGARAALWGVNEIVGLTIASLLAGLATTPYAGGGLVAYALTPEAFEEDCTRAALVVASRGDAPADCKAVVIDRALWRRRGALVLSRRGSDFVIESARPKNFDRPWSPAPVPRGALAATSGESGQAEIGSGARDATPRQEDIEADQ